jgi:hypothetical protein
MFDPLTGEMVLQLAKNMTIEVRIYVRELLSRSDTAGKCNHRIAILKNIKPIYVQ